MNGHWEELIRKVEELLHATHDPDNNYHMLIQYIIQYTSDGRQRFLRLHVICVQEVIEAMSSSGASGCALALVDLQQQLVWIYLYGLIESHSIVDEAFEEVLNDHPDLRDAVKAQVSCVSHSSDSRW